MGRDGAFLYIKGAGMEDLLLKQEIKLKPGLKRKQDMDIVTCRKKIWLPWVGDMKRCSLRGEMLPVCPSRFAQAGSKNATDSPKPVVKKNAIGSGEPVRINCDTQFILARKH